jgi:hypothetical protein
LPSNEGAVPAKDRFGRDEAGRPPFTGDQAGEGTDERSIRPCEAGTGDPALEHGQLMAQHEDLGVLRHSVHPMNADRFEHAVNEAVEEGERHRRRASPSRSYLVKPPDE